MTQPVIAIGTTSVDRGWNLTANNDCEMIYSTMATDSFKPSHYRW